MYATSDGTAQWGQDYLSRGGMIHFKAGEISKELAIPIFGNLVPRGNRNFVIELRSSDVVLGANTALITIADPNVPMTVLALDSDLGDWVGGGKQWSYVSLGATFTISIGSRVTSIDVDRDDWHAYFAAPAGQALRKKLYDNAERYPFQSVGHPGLDVYGDHRGCNTLSGGFQVNQIDRLAGARAIDFAQHCEGGDPGSMEPCF